MVYSSDKTSTQTLLAIFNKNNYKAVHCHNLNNLKLCLVNPPTKETFRQYLINYKNIKNKKCLIKIKKILKIKNV